MIEQFKMGQPDSLVYTEFVNKAQDRVEKIFELLKEAGPTVPTVEGTDPAAVGAAVAAGLEIDTEQKDTTPTLSPERMDEIKGAYMEIKKMAEVIFQNKNFANSDKDKIWEYLWSLRSEFSQRGIVID